VYEHTEETLLLRPDVGLQAQFKVKKPARAYRYDPSLDPALSWDVNADRERGEALIARIENAPDVETARTAAGELRRMSRPFLNWAGKAERSSFEVPTLPLFVHERLSTQAILQSVKSHKRDRQQSLAFFAALRLAGDAIDEGGAAYEVVGRSVVLLRQRRGRGPNGE
jgi:adenine-specific DNA-methyltransferase